MAVVIRFLILSILIVFWARPGRSVTVNNSEEALRQHYRDPEFTRYSLRQRDDKSTRFIRTYKPRSTTAHPNRDGSRDDHLVRLFGRNRCNCDPGYFCDAAGVCQEEYK